MTDVIHYDGKTFTKVGDLSTASEEDLELVSNGDCVFTEFYVIKKTRLSGGSYAGVGAVIVGTKDEELAERLHFAYVRTIIPAK